MAIAVRDRGRERSQGADVRRAPRVTSWEGVELGRILVAEDEPRISSFLERGLAAAGFTTDVAASGDEALVLARTGRFDLVILDASLPGMDGYDVLRELRRSGVRMPVVLLSARQPGRDDLTALESEAVDLLAKPFRFDELLACVRRRVRDARTGDARVTLELDDMRLDLGARRAFVDDRPVELSAREFAMAEAFFRNPGRVLTREQLLDLVWGYDFDPGSNIVDVYVGYLRRKLGKDRIASVRGRGYRLETRAGAAAA
jgi:two-component system, OmpR family, copper resistance phosphate regulon response regulator CusR